MSIAIKILVLINLVGCAKNIEPKESMALDEKLVTIDARQAEYCELSKPLYEKSGFIVSKCDGLLFASIHSIACNWPLSLTDWQGEPGQWFRSKEHNCFYAGKDNGANAESSKDMIQGWALKMFVDNDQPAITDFLEFTDSNGGYFCKAINIVERISKCFLPPTTRKLMNDFLGRRHIELKTVANKGTSAHLDVLRQLQKKAVYGAIDRIGFEVLKGQAKRQPENALYVGAFAQFKDGDMNQAADLWLSHCPEGRLPTSADHCADYLYQRDKKPKDWDSCNEGKTHFGTDCVFSASVILGEI